MSSLGFLVKTAFYSLLRRNLSPIFCHSTSSTRLGWQRKLRQVYARRICERFEPEYSILFGRKSQGSACPHQPFAAFIKRILQILNFIQADRLVPVETWKLLVAYHIATASVSLQKWCLSHCMDGTIWMWQKVQLWKMDTPSRRSDTSVALSHKDTCRRIVEDIPQHLHNSIAFGRSTSIMSIPGSQRYVVPPPLPPPTIIDGFDQGIDLGWRLQNTESSKKFRLAPIKAGSSLLSGHSRSSQLHKDEDEDIHVDLDDTYLKPLSMAHQSSLSLQHTSNRKIGTPERDYRNDERYADTLPDIFLGWCGFSSWQC